MAVTLYTDSYVVHGSVETRQRRLSDLLNDAEDGVLVLDEVTFEEYGSRSGPDRAAYAQVNVAAVLFAVSDERLEPTPEMRLPKVPQQALVSVPPFRVRGHIHLHASETLRQALTELHQRFVPVTDATYWSDQLNEPRTEAAMLAFNHARAQIMAPYQEHDPWVDARAAALGDEASVRIAPEDAAAAHEGPAPEAGDPWRDLPRG